MARYRYRRGFGKRRFKRRWKKYWRRYSRRFINGSSKSSIRIKTSFVETKTLSAGYGTTPGDVYFSSPFETNSVDGAISHSQLYRVYAGLYEEVKIIGVKVALAVVTPVGDTTTPSLQLYTAWDRKRCHSEAYPTAADLVASSTSNVATAISNNIAKINRSCYASDLMEKAQWVDATLNATYGNIAFIGCGDHCPCFHPSFMFTCMSPSLGAAHNVTISVSYTYYLAFRNPKWGGSGAGRGVGGAIPAADDDGDVMDEGDAARYLDELQHEVEVEASAPAKKKRAVVVQPLSQQKN